MDFDKLFQQFLSYEEIITIYEIKLLAFYEKFLITSQDFFEEKDFNKAKKAFANLLFFLNFFKLHNLNLLAMDKWNDFNNFSLNLQKDLNYIVSFFKFYFKEDILLLKYFKKYKKAFKQVFLLEEYFINKAAFLLAFNFSQGIFFMEALSLAAWDTVMHIIIKYKDIEQTRGSIVINFIIFLDTNMFLRHYIVFFKIAPFIENLPSLDKIKLYELFTNFSVLLEKMDKLLKEDRLVDQLVLSSDHLELNQLYNNLNIGIQNELYKIGKEKLTYADGEMFTFLFLKKVLDFLYRVFFKKFSLIHQLMHPVSFNDFCLKLKVIWYVLKSEFLIFLKESSRWKL